MILPKNKLLIILGPTATGKTSLGIRIARKNEGEIISADSRQVYRGMDIGTGKDLPVNSKFRFPALARTTTDRPNLKPPPKNSKLKIGFHEIGGVRLWLYDLCEPDYRFSVSDFLKAARGAIENIWSRDKLPIVVGGTGFYLTSLLEGVATVGIRPDRKLREKLDRWSVGRLAGYLEKADPDKFRKMNESDRQNPRRLIRAIEIARKNSHFKNGPEARVDALSLKGGKADFLIVGLKADLPFLYRRIDQRVEERVDRGVIKEIKRLVAAGYNWDNSVLDATIGYKEWRPFFESVGRPGCQAVDQEKDIIQKWKYHEHAYARRQMTWFRKMKSVRWFRIEKANWRLSVEGLVNQWYDGND